jgi:hypothetical protein
MTGKAGRLMEGTREILLQGLAVSALIGATLEYAILLRHRLERRAREAEARQLGLCALVRVMLLVE